LFIRKTVFSNFAYIATFGRRILVVTTQIGEFTHDASAEHDAVCIGVVVSDEDEHTVAFSKCVAFSHAEADTALTLVRLGGVDAERHHVVPDGALLNVLILECLDGF